MANIVLVPGAWLGSRAWEAVAGRLRAAGHDVHPLTLSGLAERATPHAAGVRLADHVADVLDFLTARDLAEVVLVGHSYAGIVTGQAASCAPERVAHTIFLDANLPRPGLAMVDGWSERGLRRVREAIEDNGGMWARPDPRDLADHDLSPEQMGALLRCAGGHPGRTLFDPAVLPLPLGELRATYVNCLRPDPGLHPDAAAYRSSPNWSFVELDTGHWPMFSRPAELADLLDELAGKQ